MTPAAQLTAFLARFDPKVARIARGALTRLRKLTPGACELVYDNYHALAIGFAANEKAGSAIVSIALYPKWVTLFFLHGKGLKDPQGLLQGSGARVRHVVLAGGAADLERPAVRALLRQALAQAKPPLDPTQRRRLLIKSVSKKQRPRR